jgi:hypothetical protein
MRSVGGSAKPSYPTTTLSSTYVETTFTVANASTWLETGTDGQATANPLGTSGTFTVVVDFGTATEEHILCSAVNTSTGVVTIWTDGTRNGRGYSTPKFAHSAGSAGTYNCFPMIGGAEFASIFSAISTIATTYAPLVSPSFTTPSLGVATATSINGTTIPSSATLVTTSTTSLPSVTSVNSTSIPSSATLLTTTSTTSALTKIGLSSAGFVKSDASGNLTVDTNTYVTPTYAGEISATDFKATGLTGATAGTRYVGGTVNGAPTTGTFAVGDFVIDQTATIWVCTTAGTPGTWWSTISNHLALRSANATAKVNEVTIFTGSSTGQTITAPPNPQDGAMWSFINRSTNNVTLGFGTNSMVPLGSGTGVTNYTVNPNEAYSFINYGGGQWYMTTANGTDHLVGILATANGGTGLSGFTSANNALYSTSSSALTAGTLPILAGGTGSTTASGALTNLGAMASNVTSLPSVTSVNGTTIPASSTLVTTATTSLPSLTTVNGTSIPASATLVTTATTSLPSLTTVNGTSIPSSATLLTSASTSSALTKVGLSSAGFVKSDASGNLSVDTNTYLTSTTGVTTFSGGSTGLLPSSATSGAVSLSGTLGVGYGGTGTTTSTGTGSVVLSQTPTFSPSATTNIGLIIKGQASQSADLLQIQNSAATPLLSVTSAGNLNLNSNKISGVYGLSISTSSVGSSTDALTFTDRSSSGSISLRSATNSSGGGLELINNAFNASVFQFKDSGAIGSPIVQYAPSRVGDFYQPVPTKQHLNGFALPLLGWTFDPAITPTVTQLVANGTVYYTAIYIGYPVSFSFFTFYLNTLGSGVSGTFMGLYSTDGRQLLAWGNSTSTTGGSVGQNNIAIVNVWNGSNLVAGTSYTIPSPGVYWLAYSARASTTLPTIVKANQTTAAIININSQAGATGTLYGRANTSADNSGAPWTNLNTSSVVTTSSTTLPWLGIL